MDIPSSRPLRACRSGEIAPSLGVDYFKQNDLSPKVRNLQNNIIKMPSSHRQALLNEMLVIGNHTPNLGTRLVAAKVQAQRRSSEAQRVTSTPECASIAAATDHFTHTCKSTTSRPVGHWNIFDDFMHVVNLS